MNAARGSGGRSPGRRAEAAVRLPDRGRACPSIVNPVIAESHGEWEFDEGCLSVPGLYFPILRPKEVHLTGYDLDGNEVSIEADELEARLSARARPLGRALLLDQLDKDQRKAAMRELRQRAEAAGSSVLRIAFLGTPEAAVVRSRALVAAGHDVAVVVTRPTSAGAATSPPGRARSRPPPWSWACRERQSRRRRRSAPSSAWSWPTDGSSNQDLLAVPLVNVHFSLLPRWRGAAPVERAILAGDA